MSVPIAYIIAEFASSPPGQAPWGGSNGMGTVATLVSTWLFSSMLKTIARSGGLHIQPDDVADLLDEKGVRGKLERLAAVRLTTRTLARYAR